MTLPFWDLYRREREMGSNGTMDKDQLNKIFKVEYEVLDNGKELLRASSLEGRSVLDQYEELLGQYEKLLKMTQRIFKISDIQGRALKRRENEVEYLSYHDPMTSLYNRSYVDKMIPQLWIDQTKFPLSILVIDLNGLKLTNDVFGHQVGDRFIQHAASIVAQCSRKTDIAVRWGGDEFLLILPNTNEELVRHFIENIKSNCLKSKADPIQVSVAMGAVTVHHASIPFNDCLAKAEHEMYKQKMLESQSVRKQILSGLVQSLETSCYEIEGHVKRLIRMSKNFLGILGIPADSSMKNSLILLAQLHDIGKVAIPKEILAKKECLTADEWEIMKTHSEVGYRMAQSIGETEVAHAILAMHERWDGSGYPQGLIAEQIPLLSRILAILDTYDVITHDRVYKNALTSKEALLEMERLSGLHFDPTLVDLFLDYHKDIIETA